MERDFSHYCEVLGVPENHSKGELKTAYYTLMKSWHPDKFQSNEVDIALATEKCKLFNESYEFLSEIAENSSGNLKSSSHNNQKEKTRASDYRNKYQTKHLYNGEVYRVGFPNPEVIEIFVKSSFIVSCGYDSSTCTLYVKFVSNRLYKYYDVPKTTFDEFLSADSLGKYANQWIFHSFKYDLCEY